jgi:hypothetical protein
MISIERTILSRKKGKNTIDITKGIEHKNRVAFSHINILSQMVSAPDKILMPVGSSHVRTNSW